MDEAEPGKSGLPHELRRAYSLARDSGEMEVAELVLRALEELARRDAEAARILEGVYLETALQPTHASHRPRSRNE